MPRIRTKQNEVISLAGVPTVTDDSTKGFLIGHRLFDTVGLDSYVCDNNAIGAAVWTKLAEGEAGVSSIFTRTGDVVAVASDYDASQVDNDSGVTGAFVSDALNTLDTQAAVQTVFTRTGDVVAVASDYDASQIDNDSSVAGATVANALDNLEAGGALQQTRALWQGLAGDNTNSGASQDTPKLTVASMITAAGSPTASTPVEMTMIGGQVNTESFTIPAFTTLIAERCEFQGAIILSDKSKLIASKVRGSASVDSLTTTGSITTFIELDELVDQPAVANQRLIVASASAIVRAKIGTISSVGTGTSNPWDLNTNAQLIMETQSFKGTNGGINIGGSELFHTTQDSDASGDSFIRNDKGSFVAFVAGDYGVSRNGIVDLSVTDTGLFAQRHYTTTGVSGAILTGNSFVVDSSFSPTLGQYILGYTSSTNSAFRNYTILTVNSNTNFTIDKLAGAASTEWAAATNGANIELSIDNNSGFTITFAWTILRVLN